MVKVVKKKVSLEDKLTYGELKFPVYINSKRVTEIGGVELNVEDAIIAAVLSGLNVLVVTPPGEGKTQLASDIYNNYFAGNKDGVWIRAKPDTEVNDIFYRLDKEEAKRVANITSIEKKLFVVDEINRAPGPVQNQFLDLGDGVTAGPDGRQYFLGKDGYSILIATANMGNGELSGTFNMDEATVNRLHITLDLSYYCPTEEDEFAINKKGGADPKVQIAPLRDLSDKIMGAYKEISNSVRDPGLEAEVVLNYIGRGLRYCKAKSIKTGAWPVFCQDCSQRENICEKMRPAAARTRKAVLKYAAGLQYLAALKAESQNKTLGKVDAFDLIFDALRIASAYHGNLNSQILRADYHDENARMAEDVVEELRKEFNKVKPYIDYSLECLRRYGEITTQFLKTDRGVYPLSNRFFESLAKATDFKDDWQKLKDNIMSEAEIIEPYKDDNGYIGLSWFPKFLENYKQNLKPQTQ